MISVDRGQRVIVTTLSFYYDGIVDDFDGVWLKLTSPKVVFSIGHMSNVKGGKWAEAEDVGAPFVAIQIAHVVAITPVVVSK